MKYLLGFDCGRTAVKAALYDEAGNEIAVAVHPQSLLSPHPGWHEFDAEGVWVAVAQTIADVIARSGISPKDIAGVGASGYGNGVYTLDERGAPIRPGFLSSDRRAVDIIQEWNNRGVPAQIAPLTLQGVFPGEFVTCLAWMKAHEPDNYVRIAHALPMKNYITFRLAGEYATDLSDISGAGPMDREWRYNKELLDIYGIPEMWPALPPVRPSHEVIGVVQPAAAAVTGLAVGTPVVVGLHDMSACPFGSGAVNVGDLVTVVGTMGFNALIVDQPAGSSIRYAVPERHFARMGGGGGANSLEWFVVNCCGAEKAEAAERGMSVYDVCNELVAEALARPSAVIYHPYLAGDMRLLGATAGFFGITNTTTKGELLRAVYEGVAFSLAAGVQELTRQGTKPERVLLSGGGSKSAVWSQIFADAFGLPVLVAAGSEHGTHGAALCAGIGAGIYADYHDAATRGVAIARRHEPDGAANAATRARYDEFVHLIEVMGESWERWR